MKRYKTLDLHGLKDEEVFNRLDRFIRQHSEEEEVALIVGKGRGVIKRKAVEYLEMCHYKWRYSRDHGRENRGSLIVELI